MHLPPERPLPLASTVSTHSAAPEPWLRHLCFFGPVAAITVAALALALHAMPLAGGARALYAVAVAVNVGLLALASWGGVLGGIVALGERLVGKATGPVLRPPTGQARTAVLLPVYEEDAIRVFAAAAVMRDSLARERLGAADIFVLSDTRSAAGAAAEEQAHRRVLAMQPAGGPAIHYRRRVRNDGRKAGNIAEFCGRWGAAYDFMVVLDADSLMTGAAIATLVGAMEANPRAGLVQSMCYPVGRASLFARAQQFAARLQGPLLARGAAFWQGPRGSYWGHNAIIRIAAFAAHCGLPELPGPAPLGGEILCHDTVEAALMLRAGWDAWLLPDIGGSWEETPTNLLDHLQRDRRWCQGNLQHAAVLRAEGLKPASFLHLGQGIAHYLSAPLFVALLALSALPGGHLAGPAGALDATVLALLFAPRLLALAAALADGRVSAGLGGRGRLLASALLDQVLGVLVSPVTAVFHTLFVARTLAGRVVGWDAQPRDDRGLGWAEAWRCLGLPLAGAAALAGLLVSPWAAAILLAGVPVAVWSSRLSLGQWTRRLGLFAIPEEGAPPALLLALAQAQSDLRNARQAAAPPALPREAGVSVAPQELRPAWAAASYGMAGGGALKAG